MTENDTLFMEALRNKDRETIIGVPKSDLHNHIPYGGNRIFLGMIENRVIPKLNGNFCDIPEMNRWCKANIKIKNDYQLRVLAGYIQAKEDGIKVFAPNFATCALKEFDSFNAYIDFIKKLNDLFENEMQIYPELCLDRNKYGDETEETMKKFLSTGIFKSLDLVGDELYGVDSFIGCYRIAEEFGIIKKAHVGEFASHEYVIDAIRKLKLDSVHHGITLAEDEDAMEEVKEKKITLFICPSSNLTLSRVSSIKLHPITKFHRFGIKVSIGSDDMLIFDSSVTDEYLRLTETTLTTAEINEIRLNGLNYYN